MRHRQRHLHATLVKHIRDSLVDLGWINAPVNFGGTPVTVLDYQPQEAGVTPAANTVAVSIGHEGTEDPYEMGGGVSCAYVLFVDVYGENEPVGVALADDIKQMLVERYLPLRDFTTSADGVETEDLIELESVLIEVVSTATTTLDKRSWRAVKATAVCYF